MSYYQFAEDRPSVPIDFSKTFDTASLKDQNVIITGGAMGIGQGLVNGFAEAGAYVTIADVSVKEGVETFAELIKKGHKVQFVKTDVLSWASLVNAFKTALAFGPNNSIDIVIPNAGIGGLVASRWLENVALDAAGDPLPMSHKALDINLEAVFTTTHLALHYFKQHPGPKGGVDKQIVFVSSMAGFSSMTNATEYCCSKWGVRGLFRSLRGAHKVLGEDRPVLRANMINPGYIRTPLTKELHTFEDNGKMKMGRPSDVVEVVLRLCSDRNIIGRAVSINGGGINFDLGDDFAGGEGYLALAERRKMWMKAAEQQKETPPKENGTNGTNGTNGVEEIKETNGTVEKPQDKKTPIVVSQAGVAEPTAIKAETSETEVTQKGVAEVLVVN